MTTGMDFDAISAWFENRRGLEHMIRLRPHATKAEVMKLMESQPAEQAPFQTMPGQPHVTAHDLFHEPERIEKKRRFMCLQCGKDYASTDGVLKHCKQKHMAWLQAAKANKEVKGTAKIACPVE